VRDRIITHSICEALRTHLPSGRFAGCILYLEVPANEVDVNVHPTKAEVKFRDSNLIHGFVSKSIELGLGKRIDKPTATPKREREAIRDDFFPFKDLKAMRSIESFKGSYSSHQKSHDYIQEIETGDHLKGPGYFSSLHIVGQIRNSYIVCSDDEGLIIIDQHAAHERLTFEDLRERFASRSIPVQNLLFPVEFEVKGERSTILGDNLTKFAEFGFLIEGFGKNSFLLRGVPEILTDTDNTRTINEMIDMISEYSQSPSDQKRLDEILETMACHSSVRFHHPLSHQEMHELLNRLDSLKQARSCPHGRPFLASLSESELRKMFKRT
jgi:DNA mismatch repair protein MutL